jgi:ABC-type ATPase with predicted acetyltransferase domain
MKFNITVKTALADTYRSNRVRSLFNVSADQAAEHVISVDVPHEAKPWRIGAIIGPSGTGKTTLGKQILGAGTYLDGFDWPTDTPIVDAMGIGHPFDDVSGALSSVGLGSVPSWLRPYHVLSGGERFRADLARALLDTTGDIVIDEFTSVVDRQVAQVGANAFGKAWRRKPTGRAVVLACHYDITDWLQPDWILDTGTWSFQWRSVQRRPDIKLDIWQTNWSAWPAFEKHHYLKLNRMIAAYNYVATVDGTPVAHVAVGTTAGLKAARLCRLVVMPEWQGAGVGMKFLEAVAQLWLDGENRYRKPMTGILHTSHPGLIAAFRRSERWVTVSQMLGGVNKAKSRASMLKAGLGAKVGYGGHDRAVSAFRYVGDRP